MNQVSQFTINQKTLSLTQTNSCTPHTYKTQSPNKKQTDLPSTISAFQTSNYKCNQCSQHLSTITQSKKQQILLQYKIQVQKQEIQKLRRQNEYLIKIQYNSHKINLQKYNPIMYFKQDLESELCEAKYLLELHILSKSQQIINGKVLNIKQSKKQKQIMDQISKPVDLKKKCEQLLMQNIKLQQKNMIKEKIIEQRGLFPLYHYDERILTLRKAVQYWYRKAQQQSIKLGEMINEVKKMHKQIKKQVKITIQQDRIYWQNEIKKVIYQLNYMVNNNKNKQNETNSTQNNTMNEIKIQDNQYENIKNNHNQDNQNKNKYKYNQYKLQKYNSQKQNILIQDDHTILSICQKIKQKKYNSHNNNNQQIKSNHNPKSKQNKNKSIHHNNNNLCESCLVDQKNKSKLNHKNKSIIKSNKNSSKYQSNKLSSQKYQPKPQEIKKKTIKKQRISQQINSSMIGKNFQNIQIKIKNKTNNHSPKLPLNHINCQRCADRIL